jgi:hypothetical protein
MGLTAAAVMLPATPASATTCVIQNPGIEDVYCLLYGTPGVNYVCEKVIRVCP